MQNGKLPFRFPIHYLMFLPLIELIILRLPHPAFTLPGIQPAVLITPSIVFLLLFIKWNSEKKIPTRINYKLLVYHFIFLSGLIILTLELYAIPQKLINNLCWVGLAGVVFLSAFFSFVSPHDFWKRFIKEKKDWPPALLTAGAFLLYHSMADMIWFHTKEIAVKLLILSRCLPGLQNLKVMSFPAGPMIEMPWGSLRIYKGCSGLESISLFLFFWGIILLFDGQTLSKAQKWGVTFVGILFMCVLNMIRLLSLIYLGNKMFAETHNIKTTDLVVTAFHNDYAWGLYFVGLLLFFSTFYGFLSLKKSINA